LISYQVVGYDWSDSHWINNQITKHTGYKLNHIGIRFYIVGSVYETFVGAKGSDNLIHSRTIQRKYGGEFVSTKAKQISSDKLQSCIQLCDGYGIGNVPYAYLWWYTGKILPAPKSCTDLACKCLQAIGLNVKERALPHQLFKEAISCM